jgi:hypothetical protein
MIRAAFFIVSLAIMVGALWYVATDFVSDHAEHGHYNLADPEHITGLAVAVIGAFSTLSAIMWRRRRRD